MSPVTRINPETGELSAKGVTYCYDRIVNVAGPWAEKLLHASGIYSAYRLDLVRGSHIVIPGKQAQGCVLQVPSEKRILFVLPHGESTLLGTTEVSQTKPDTCAASEEEIAYLIGNYNRCFCQTIEREDIIDGFAGIRPIVATNSDFSAASRESIVERNARVINVFGGKWTTSRALAKEIVQKSLH